MPVALTLKSTAWLFNKLFFYVNVLVNNYLKNLFSTYTIIMKFDKPQNVVAKVICVFKITHN